MWPKLLLKNKEHQWTKDKFFYINHHLKLLIANVLKQFGKGVQMCYLTINHSNFIPDLKFLTKNSPTYNRIRHLGLKWNFRTISYMPGVIKKGRNILIGIPILTEDEMSK